MWVSLALVWGGKEGSAVWTKREREPQAMWGRGGEGQVKCRWWWFVALLIGKSAPLGGGHAPGWRARPWVEGAPLGGGRAPG
jgi:hypothetical protein